MKELNRDSMTEYVRKCLDSSGHDRLREFLSGLQPFDISVLVQDLSETEQLAVLSLLPAETAADVLEHMDLSLIHI